MRHNEGPSTDAGAPEDEELEDATVRRKIHRAAWAKYMRTFGRAEARDNRTEKIPQELVAEITSLDDRKYWFEVWSKSAQSWATVKLTEEFQKVARESHSEVQGWMTQSQIAKLYASEMLAAEIVKVKRGQPAMSKPHPEIPDVELARLYLVRVSSTKTEEIEQMHKQGVVFEAICNKASAQQMLPHMAALVGPQHAIAAEGPALPGTPALPVTPDTRTLQAPSHAPPALAPAATPEELGPAAMKLQDAPGVPPSVQRAINRANEAAARAQQKTD